jgi:hypothetical protein
MILVTFAPLRERGGRSPPATYEGSMSEQAQRSRDVFISYSSLNKTCADAACAVLEKHRIRCWIAPRDILPGSEWGASIIEGIESCKVMVLILSAHANASEQVRREVERAIAKGLIVLPFRVEDVSPKGSIEFAIGKTHWLDAFPPPLEHYLEALAKSVAALLADESPTRPTITPARPPRRFTGRWPLAAGIAGIAMTVGIAGYLLSTFVGGRRFDAVVLEPHGNHADILDPDPKSPLPVALPKSADKSSKQTKDLAVGATVRVTKYIGGYFDDGGARLAAMVDEGQTGEVLELPSNNPHCQVRFDAPVNRSVWILREALKVE